MRRSGTSVPWIAEHAVKAPHDLRVLADVFENMDLVADYEAFKAHQAEVGENGLPVAAFTIAAGPVHHIQKYFLDATEFFHYYRDHQPEILYLADALAPLYEKALRIVAESPAEVIQWGSNFDDMLTFPPMFAQHFVPWIRKAKEVLGPKNIRILCHTDGENFGLMDLLNESGMDVAEEERPQVLALSALLTTTMPEMARAIVALAQAGARENVKVIGGGAPVNQNFADDIGADGYARDAAAAIDLVRSLIG